METRDRARCRCCEEPISSIYPLGEIAIGLLWALCAARWGATFTALRVAVFLTILHALADGVGFQSIVASLTDEEPVAQSRAPAVTVDERIPTAPEWSVRAGIALMGDARAARGQRQTQADAQAALDAYKREHRRAKTPTFALSGATS